MKIAYFSPLSPIKSGISEYSEGLLPHLAKHLEIDLVLDNYIPSNPEITDRFRIIPYADFPELSAEYDSILYHIGNNLYHQYMLPFVFEYPGIAVLHDTSLFHLIAGIAFENQDYSFLKRELTYCYGELGESVAHRFWEGVFAEIEKFVFPVNQHIIDASQAVVVHSQYDVDQIRARHPGKLVLQIPMHFGNSHPENFQEKNATPAIIRNRLGFDQNQFIVASFGFISMPKRIAQILHAFAQFVLRVPNAMYVLVGESTPTYSLSDLIRSFKLKNKVRITEYVSAEEFSQYLNIADVCINLRYPTAGETSATLIRCFAAGKPTLVSNYRQYVELPDESCIKIDLGSNEEQQIIDALIDLYSHPERRHQLGENAKQYAATTCDVDKAVKQYLNIITKIANPP